MEYKKIKIEYILMALMFASVVESIFAGFRISRLQWVFVLGSVLFFLFLCIMFDYNKKSLWIMILLGIIYWGIAHSQLINGFEIINNKMAEALNQSMDLGFYYYISVILEYSRRDSILAVTFFVLVTGVVFGVLRYRPLILFVITGVMEIAILMIAPYGISSAFFLFLGLWIVYFSIRKGKKGFAGLVGILFLISSVVLYFYDQTHVPTDTMIKRATLVKIREFTQGKGYLAVGGIGDGKLRNVGEVSPTGEKLFLVYAPEKDDLFLKGFVSGIYKDGEWEKDEKEPLLFGGEAALSLPYLFPDLSMQNFVTYQKGYIKTEKDIAFSEKRQIKIHYQKMSGSELLVPYFSDVAKINGNMVGDSDIERNTGEKDYETSYYQMKNLDNLLKLSRQFDMTRVMRKDSGEIEKNFVRSMQEYSLYVEQNYLKIPDHLQKVLKQLDCKVNEKKTISYNIEVIRRFLKKNYQYTYRPGLVIQGKDPIEYFLRDRKKGFCTQYASAAVFLFREAKIPARYVEGYKIRADQWHLGKAQVTDYEAHAWVEIYVDHLGWVPIDVTGRNTGENVYKQVEKEEKQRNAIVPNKEQFVTNVKKMFQIIPMIVVLGIFLFSIKMLQERRKWKQMSRREKVLYYAEQIEKYKKNNGNTGVVGNRMFMDVIEKARYSNNDLSVSELNLVKRQVQLLKRKNRNVTKILSKLK